MMSSSDRHPDRRPDRAGFTLLELIVSMGISFLLVIALYQAIQMQFRYQEIVSQTATEAQVARTLLQRLGEEIRSLESVETSADSSTDSAFSFETTGSRIPDWVRQLLDHGNAAGASGMLSIDSLTGSAESETSAAAPVALLGTRDRLLVRLPAGRPRESAVEQTRLMRDATAAGGNPLEGQFAGAASAASSTTTPGANRQAPLTPQTLQRIAGPRYALYVGPVLNELGPSGSQRSAQQPESDSPALTPPDGTAEAPLLGGVLRFEFSQPEMTEVQTLLSGRLEQWVQRFTPDAADLADPVADDDLAAGDQAMLARMLVSARLLDETVTALRFRYHDGNVWQDEWRDGSRLPRAIEIRLSFDPEAQLLEDEMTPGGAGADLAASVNPGNQVSGNDFASPFPYRLVVALNRRESDEPQSPTFRPDDEDVDALMEGFFP